MAGLIGFKIVCCGALLLATGALSVGTLAAILGSPAVRLGGSGLLAAALAWMIARRWITPRHATCAPRTERTLREQGGDGA